MYGQNEEPLLQENLFAHAVASATIVAELNHRLPLLPPYYLPRPY